MATCRACHGQALTTRIVHARMFGPPLAPPGSRHRRPQASVTSARRSPFLAAVRLAILVSPPGEPKTWDPFSQTGP